MKINNLFVFFLCMCIQGQLGAADSSGGSSPDRATIRIPRLKLNRRNSDPASLNLGYHSPRSESPGRSGLHELSTRPNRPGSLPTSPRYSPPDEEIKYFKTSIADLVLGNFPVTKSLSVAINKLARIKMQLEDLKAEEERWRTETFSLLRAAQKKAIGSAQATDEPD